MKCSKGALAAAALLAVASCSSWSPRQPTAGNFGADSLWDDGREEVSSYVGADESGLQTRLLVGHMTVAVRGGERRARGASNSQYFSLDYSIAAQTIGVLDSAVRAAMFPRSDFEDLVRGGITAVHFGPRDTVIAAVEPMARRGLRIAWTGDPTKAAQIHGMWPDMVRLRWPSSDRPHVCYDALTLWLRQWVGEKPPWEMRIWLLPSLVGELNSIRRTRPVDATIRVVDGDALQVPAGRFHAVEVLVAAGGKADVFWFDARSPHLLLKLETAAHVTLELQHSERVASGEAPRF
jgi:hypothetical protein